MVSMLLRLPSANHISQHCISWNDGVAINMDQPHPGVGGRHREIFTYGNQLMQT